MKCTSKFFRLITLITVAAFCLSGCSYFSYSAKYSVSSSTADARDSEVYPTFASDICVVNTDVDRDSLEIGDSLSAGLFDLNSRETLFAKNVNDKALPASLTKVMTAYVALKYGSLDQVLVAGSDVYVNESGAQKVGLKEGDRMTLDQALRLLLIYSANDVANLIASNIGGSIDGFVDMMNQEAINIGATNSHFQNPHGLQAEDHYVTAYDMYLIFNAAMGYDTFQEIINMKEYSTSYQTASGGTKDVSVSSTNGFINGNSKAPSGITVIGGKTGTTTAAGHCLILLAKDGNENPYIAVIMRDTDSGTLYKDMSNLLSEITN
ncbi:D-alanyl-D-alanine carboxypeptidase [Butyrivibrio hungatei DSM 14810]|uniref:D-alanyl-D-alanine carboxypeptidase n=1 Tax=Butyrivibrio hungatei DSM 14810 TaxID=1121132 RepID=A0A1M7SLK9_9FIRM|nr:serine hydrolase [Butyrivibrio hungatei]SHN59345.1 D-alanyl-D-alanine carboxypeptidase [Butyrivibrio hungatei DSM 14810]